MQKAKGTPAFLFLYTNLHKIKDSKIDAGFCHLSSKWLYIITNVWLKFFFPIDFFLSLSSEQFIWNAASSNVTVT